MTDTAEVIPGSIFETLKEKLRSGDVVGQALPEGLGHLHVDRLQPFICVYRKPSGRDDAGTRQLLSGQASYVLGNLTGPDQPELSAFLSELTDVMLEAYGAALILELWSAPLPERNSAGEQPLPTTYRIVAERHGVSQTTIHTLEHALLAIEPSGACQIVVDYLSQATPVGLPPLLPAETTERYDVFMLGLEVPMVFRDPESGKVIPQELRCQTRHLSRALRQAFYAFSHAHARNRPSHFHELGPRAMGPEVAQVDRGLAAVGDAFDLLLHVTPVNAEAAFERFVANGCNEAPEFLYRPATIDDGALKLSLYQVPLETIEDPALHHIYAAQRDELDRQITMLADRNTSRFLLESQQVFGKPDKALLEISLELLGLQGSQGERTSSGGVIVAEDFARLAEQELMYYREFWPDLPARVELRDDVPGVMVSKGHFLIGSNAAVLADRVAPLLHHEIGTHVLTYYNGLKQPLSQFHSGMPGYEETQEGLAVLSEYLCGGLDTERLRTLAVRVIAVESVIDGADFIETYRLLTSKHGFGKRDAFTIAMRVHRGGGLTKDIVYLRGLVALLDYLSAGHSLDDMFLGKVTLGYMEIVEELRWRRIVLPGPLRPRYLDDPKAQIRLSRLPSGDNVSNLLMGLRR